MGFETTGYSGWGSKCSLSFRAKESLISCLTSKHFVQILSKYVIKIPKLKTTTHPSPPFPWFSQHLTHAEDFLRIVQIKSWSASWSTEPWNFNETHPSSPSAKLGARKAQWAPACLSTRSWSLGWSWVGFFGVLLTTPGKYQCKKHPTCRECCKSFLWAKPITYARERDLKCSPSSLLYDQVAPYCL